MNEIKTLKSLYYGQKADNYAIKTVAYDCY